MVATECALSCDKCGSMNLEMEEEFCNQHFVVEEPSSKPGDDYHFSWVADKKRICHCRNCGYTFGEKSLTTLASWLPFEFGD